MNERTRREKENQPVAPLRKEKETDASVQSISPRRPNIIIVFGDQWRAQATGYSGNSGVKTPNLDAFAAESVNFTNAISGCPVCSPYRASLLTGLRPLNHGVFLNDTCLRPQLMSMGKLFARDGYDTAYIGKWHVDGHGRSNWIPPVRRHGFDYWKVLECTHDYNRSAYYAHDSREKMYWDGYDAEAQTRDAVEYVNQHDGVNPFLLVLSWGPPHSPYDTAPQRYRAMYEPADIRLRPNVPNESAEAARADLAGYYAHCSALDACFGDLLEAVERAGHAEDTLILMTSDHGDMLHSHEYENKQQPWDESIRVPFLLRYPRCLGRTGRELEAPIDAPDILPTLLSASGWTLPGLPALSRRGWEFDGLDFSGYLRGGADPSEGTALICCPQPFGQWLRSQGGREYRGLRTSRYTYVQALNGPWLLFDNENDPYQQRNLVDQPEYACLQQRLEAELRQRLNAAGDEFLAGERYIHHWGYDVDQTGTVPYTQ